MEMDSVIREYREKHSRCSYCKYRQVKEIAYHFYSTCLVKDKELSTFKEMYGGRFCSYYRPSDIV